MKFEFTADEIKTIAMALQTQKESIKTGAKAYPDSEMINEVVERELETLDKIASYMKVKLEREISKVNG